MKLLSFLAKFPLLIFILLLTLLNVNDYFHAGFPYTHDGENHLARFANYKVAVREGQIPPRFAPNLVNHYGYPVFNYNYPLANILSLPFSIAGVSYELTFKLLVVGFLVFGLWGMNEWLKSWQFKFYERWLGLVFFSLSPYLLTAIIYRGSIGEVMAMAFLPWLLRLVEQVRAGEWQMDLRKWRNWPKLIWPTLLFGLFFLSHNVAVLFGMGIILLYASLRLSKNWRSWLSLGGMILSGLALSLWFWLPALAEKSLVVLDQANLSNEFTNHFATWQQLLFSPLQFGLSFPGSVDGLSFGLGLLQWMMLLVGLILLVVRLIKQQSAYINRLQNRGLLMTAIGLASLLVIFQLGFTASIWQLIPLANYIQFPWRLTLFFSVLMVPVMAWVWQQTPAKGRWLWLLVLIIQLIGHWRAKPIDYFHRTNLDYDSFTQSSTTLNENTPVGYDYQIRDWQPAPSVLEEERGATIQVFRWQGSSRHYQVQVDKPATIIEPTMNFAGWETKIKDKDRNQTFTASYINNDEIGGRLAYQIEPGDYEIKSQFTQKTWPRLIGNTVSAIIMLAILGFGLVKILGQRLGFFLSWKVGLFAVAFIAGLFISYQPSFPYADAILAPSQLPQWLYSWANFDGVHYLTIAERGYLGTGLVQAFFPVLPMLMNYLQPIFGSPIISGLVITTIFSYVLLKTWQKLLLLEQLPKWLGTFILFLFPTAFFFNALYTEAIFLTLILLSFISARQGKWWRAGIAAALASATRVTGVLLLPALMWELGEQIGWVELKNNFHRHWPKILAILCGGTGLLLYMIYLQHHFQDSLYFLHVQAEFGGGRQESLILLPQVIWRYIKMLTSNSIDLRYFSLAQEFLAGVLGTIALIWAWFKVRRSYVIFSALAFILPTLTGTFSSLPRYLLGSFAIFLLMTQLLQRRRRLAIIWLVLSTFWLIFNTILFIQGYWVA